MSDSLFPEEPEDTAEDTAWRPVWKDDEVGSEAAVPSWISPSRARAPQRREPDWSALLVPLAAAEDALSRLDAAAEAASPALREGLVARLAFAEAAGWLAAAADRAWIHPRDLALAEAGLLGDFSAAALGGRGAVALPATSGILGTPGRARALLAEAADRLPDGATLAQGLALARALRRLARPVGTPSPPPKLQPSPWRRSARRAPALQPCTSGRSGLPLGAAPPWRCPDRGSRPGYRRCSPQLRRRLPGSR